MTDLIKHAIWNQFGASLDMLENAIQLCSAEVWDGSERFWYNAYHCLFFTDYYLSMDPVEFSPPSPFSLSEFEDRMPDRVYTKEELLGYVQFCRTKCHNLLNELTPEMIQSKWTNESKTMSYPVLEILLYNMRHIQHHAAQLNLILRKAINGAPEWVSRTVQPL